MLALRIQIDGRHIECCKDIVYTCRMIASWRHKGLQAFFATGSKKGIQPKHAKRLKEQLTLLNASTEIRDMNVPGWRLHSLQGEDAGLWSIWVNGNWRVTFRFQDGDAELVDYRDYH